MEENRNRFTPVTGAASLRIPEMFVMKADGTDLLRLTHNLGDDDPLSFSSDGKRIFYCRMSEYGTAPMFKGVSVMDAEGTNSRDLGVGSTPALSSDMGRIVFITGRYGRAVGLMDADGTRRRTIHSCEFYHSEPLFTPDGSHVVFVEWPEQHGAGSVKVLDLETSKIETAPVIERIRE